MKQLNDILNEVRLSSVKQPVPFEDTESIIYVYFGYDDEFEYLFFLSPNGGLLDPQDTSIRISIGRTPRDNYRPGESMWYRLKDYSKTKYNLFGYIKYYLNITFGMYTSIPRWFDVKRLDEMTEGSTCDTRIMELLRKLYPTVEFEQITSNKELKRIVKEMRI